MDLYCGRGRKGKHLSRKRALTEQATASVILLFSWRSFHGAWVAAEASPAQQELRGKQREGAKRELAATSLLHWPCAWTEDCSCLFQRKELLKPAKEHFSLRIRAFQFLAQNVILWKYFHLEVPLLLKHCRHCTLRSFMKAPHWIKYF